MAQTPILGSRAVSPVPITGSSIGSDPATTGSPGGNTTVEADLTELYALIAALPLVTGTQVPTLIQSGETFAIADNRQAVYTLPLVIESGGTISIGANARFVEVN